MRIYLDTEFTSFDYRTTSLISLAALTDGGNLFYAEFDDVDWSQASEWVNRNVRPLLGQPYLDNRINLEYVKGSANVIRWVFLKWLRTVQEKLTVDRFNQKLKQTLNRGRMPEPKPYLQKRFIQRVTTFRQSKPLELEFWTESGDFDWVLFANWLAEDFGGNLTAFSQASGFNIPYHHKDLVRYVSPENSWKIYRDQAPATEKATIDQLIGTGTKHAAWADAIALRAMVNHFVKSYI